MLNEEMMAKMEASGVFNFKGNKKYQRETINGAKITLDWIAETWPNLLGEVLSNPKPEDLVANLKPEDRQKVLKLLTEQAEPTTGEEGSN